MICHAHDDVFFPHRTNSTSHSLSLDGWAGIDPIQADLVLRSWATQVVGDLKSQSHQWWRWLDFRHFQLKNQIGPVCSLHVHVFDRPQNPKSKKYFCSGSTWARKKNKTGLEDLSYSGGPRPQNPKSTKCFCSGSTWARKKNKTGLWYLSSSGSPDLRSQKRFIGIGLTFLKFKIAEKNNT